MTTSLAEQLKRLQAPQTSQFTDLKKRDSILFSAKDAATKSRETIYEIGLSGLEELIEINPSFAEFQSTLFDHTSKDIQRAVETKEMNELLNKNIKRFLFHLSPYFLLQPTQKCLEWLIRRFNINLYNRNEFLALILPYHQTKIFVHCIQIMKFDDPLDEWIFLATVKKSGSPISKQAIWNHASSNPSFIEFVGKFTYDNIKELGQRAGSLQTLISFYFTTIIGTLEHSNDTKENHILSIIKYLGKTYKSDIVDYTAAGYIITGHMLTKTKLIIKLLNSIMDQILANVKPQLAQNAVFLLVIMFETQTNDLELTDVALEKFIDYPWSIKVLSEIQSEGRIVIDFMRALVRKLMKKVQENETKQNEYPKFCENLFNQLNFSDDDACVIIRTILESYVQVEMTKSHPDNEIVTIDSDDEETIPFKSHSVTSWYSKVLKMFERRYPVAFDVVIKNVMTHTTRNKRNSLKNVLGFLLKMSYNNGSSTNIFEDLYHHNPQIRAEAVSYIVENVEKLSFASENNEILKLSINERINDDNPDVVDEVLKINDIFLKEILGENELKGKLMKILMKYWHRPDKWLKPCKKSLLILSNDDCYTTFIAFLPFLFPKNESDIDLMQIIYNSEFGKKLGIPSSVKGQNKEKICKFTHDHLKKSEFISNSLLMKSIDTILNEHHHHLRGLSEHFILYALTLSIRTPMSSTESLQALRCVKRILKNSKFSMKSITDTSTIKNREVPLQVLSFFVEKLINSTDFSSKSYKINFKSENDEKKLLFEIFEFLVNEFFISQEETSRDEINQIINIFLNFICENNIEKLEFMSQFCTIHTINCDYFELQMRVMQLIANVAPALADGYENLSNDFFMNIVISLAAKTNLIRVLALQIVDLLLTFDINPHWKIFFEKVHKRKNEIAMDSEQIGLLIYLLISGKKKANFLKYIIGAILTRVDDVLVEDYIQSELLFLLKHLTEKQVVDAMAKIALKFIENSSDSFDENQGKLTKLMLMKINSENINNLWNLASKALYCHNFINDENGKILTPSIIILNTIENDIFMKLHPDCKNEIFVAIITCSMLENSKIIQAARKAFQNIEVDSKKLREILAKMFRVEQKNNIKELHASFTSNEWKFGIVLLELLQAKRKTMKNQHELIEVLFESLHSCLQITSTSEIEYAIQIILTLLLSICQQLSPNGYEHHKYKIPDSVFRTELVVNCIKLSHNPQIQHHALLLLAHLGKVTPDQVLHDIIPIFTFVGTALVRHDDSYSYQIIEKVIENIVPKLIRKINNDDHDLKTIVPILKIFSSTVLNVPEYRRLALYEKLITTLGAEKFLWPFIATLLENQVMIKKKERQETREDLPPQLYFALLLTKQFDLKTIIITANSLLMYIKSLPMVITTHSTTADNQVIFCVKSHTLFQLRYFKYIMTVFLRYLLESPEVVSKAKATSVCVDFESLISNCLLLIPIVTKYYETNQSEKMTCLFLQNLYDILEESISLLSPNMLLIFVEKLIEHNSMHVRRKTIEIFNWKLETSYFDECEQKNVMRLINPLRKILKNIKKNDTTPIEEILHQTALVSIKNLSKKFAEESSDVFLEILEELASLLEDVEGVKKEVVSNLIICIGELVFDLKVLAIGMLDKILAPFICLLVIQDDNRSSINLLFAVVSSLLKIIETVPLFLSPYLKQIVQQISRVGSALKELKDPKISQINGKISKIWNCMGCKVPIRVLIPTVTDVYNKIADKGYFSSIEPLMELSIEIFTNASGSDLKIYQSELTDFFIQSLDFRLSSNECQLAQNDVNEIELLIIKAVTALVVKQSEGSFRPFYETIYEWGIKENESSYYRAITFFRLTNEISLALKSLFLLFASDIIDCAAILLNKSNPSKTDELCFNEENELNLYLTEYILKSLHNIFLHDHQNFINSQRFDVIMQPIVDEIDNDLIVNGKQETQDLLKACIAQLAVAASDDILWKQLNYQVLLKTRSDSSKHRILGLQASIDIAKKLGEDFEPLIPETIPFLSELLEDENHTVVKACQDGVRELELAVGESLQKYF